LLFECRSIPLNLFMPASCASSRWVCTLTLRQPFDPNGGEACYMITRTKQSAARKPNTAPAITLDTASNARDTSERRSDDIQN
ncbi:MAG: hypothetical protein QOJ04_6473, partial [Caballeronia sp.]|nr:hypothetical protein [Caballeronia sp.]